VHVPYKGSAPSLTDLVGGQTQFTAETVNAFLHPDKAWRRRDEPEAS
jgi:tripartite-type tricarboxylate transporter receptor subunit TctC